MVSIFTRIIEGEIPSYRVYEDERVVAFLDINPAQPGHTLVVPRVEVPDLFDLGPEDYRAVWAACRTVAGAIKDTTGCERVVVLVFGYDVPHAHVHLIPTTRDSGFPFPEPIAQTPEQMEAMAARLTDAARAAESTAYGPETALLVVDVQNDFADPAGNLAVGGGDEIVPLLSHEVELARDGGAAIAFTQDWHPESTPHFEKDGGIWPVHCVAGTWGAELHPGLTVPDGAIRIRKGTGGEDGYSGFSMRDPTGDGEPEPTGLHQALQERGISRVVVAGLATDYCVKETVLDALRLGYRTIVIGPAVRAVDLEPGDGERALEEMGDAGAVILE
jgi:nicotinamidase/pyrazinamidase